VKQDKKVIYLNNIGNKRAVTYIQRAGKKPEKNDSGKL
jgi:hypothetical protein